jgi:anti-sigma regulatory factor (Ser/Thr protein kinase)
MQELLQYGFPSDTAQLEQMRRRIRDTLHALDCSKDCIESCVLAVDEAASNVMRHGYGVNNEGQLLLTVAVDGTDLVFLLRDFAAPFDADAQQMPANGELRVGGYGRLLINEIMDSVRYCEVSTGNLLEMRRRLELTTQA